MIDARLLRTRDGERRRHRRIVRAKCCIECAHLLAPSVNVTSGDPLQQALLRIFAVALGSFRAT